MNLVPAGKYLARPVDWGISETKAGEPQAFVTFEFGEHKLTWFGSFKEGRAQEITIDALLTLGLSTNDISDLASNVNGVLDTTKDVQIVVEHEDYNGKTSAKIRWVNPLGGGGVKKMEHAKTKSLGALKGAVMARRKEMGVEATPKHKAVAGIDEDLPF